MDNRYAMVWTSTLGYMPGTNAILNALEFYGFEGIDVYILMDRMDLERLNERRYLGQFPGVHFVAIDYGFWHEPKDTYWYMVFADLDFALRRLFDQYRVVLFWGADVCVVNNFQQWFEVADRLDTIVMGTNDQYGGNPDKLDRLMKEWPYIQTWDVPYADIPMFFPETKRGVIQLTLDYQRRTGVRVDRMDGLNYAIRDLDEKIMTVPGVYWIFNVPMMAPLEWSGNHLYLHGTRMESFHRKYWSAEFCRSYFGNVKSEIKMRNIKIMNGIWNWFNRMRRVKWTEGIEEIG